MRPHQVFVLGAAVLLAAVVPITARQGTPPASAPGVAPPLPGAANPPVPGTAENPRPNQPGFIGFEREPPPMNIPAGFTPLFNGQNLSGWHVSTTNHHGHTPDFHVSQGMIIGGQQPLGSGGILLTDRKFKNFELYMEVKPDYGCDSGIFLRSTEWGAAYQVTMDYLPGGGMGNVISEGGITGVGGRGRAAGPAAATAPGAAAGRAGAPAAAPAAAAGGPAGGRAGAPAGAPAAAGGQGGRAAGAPPIVGGIPLGSTTPNGEAPWMKVWKREDWNSVRVRMTGEVPHVIVWMNDVQITDFTDVANNAMFGMWDGPIAIQVHGGTRCAPGAFWRWRVIAYKDLP